MAHDLSAYLWFWEADHSGDKMSKLNIEHKLQIISPLHPNTLRDDHSFQMILNTDFKFLSPLILKT